MKISLQNNENCDVYELQGELNFQTSPDLRDQLAASLKKKTQGIVVCMQKVTYIDSSGLATFVEALQKTKLYNGRLILSGLTPAVLGVFEIAKLDNIFLLVNDRDEALNKLHTS